MAVGRDQAIGHQFHRIAVAIVIVGDEASRPAVRRNDLELDPGIVIEPITVSGADAVTAKLDIRDFTRLRSVYRRRRGNIADALNAQGWKTSRGNRWTRTGVARVLSSAA